VKIFKIVVSGLMLSGVAACPSAREPPPPASAAPPAPAAPAASPRSGVSRVNPAADIDDAAGVPSAAGPAPKTSSAYLGCGQSIPVERLWDETTEGEVLDAIASAKACAAEHGRRLLLEFVAPWCEDCQEMAKLDATSEVAATLKERFERVRVNVGKWDRHEGLRQRFDVHALATYVVLEPKTSAVLAKTTLEPITKKGQRLSAADWARWLSLH
jgi:hypothetical protein